MRRRHHPASQPATGRRGAALACLLLAAACTGPRDPVGSPSPTGTGTPATSTADGVPDPDAIDPARLEPLAALPACPSPAPSRVEAPAHLPLPPGAAVAQSSTDGPLQSVQGFTPHTPVEVMVDYLRRAGVDVLAAEDEVFESEVLLRADDLQVFVKTQAACDRGSAFVLFASADAAEVPTPAGAG